MSVPAYESYRDSGVAWIGDVPAHWDVTAGRRIFKQTRTPAAPEDEQLSSTQKYGVIPQRLFMSLEDQKVVLAMGGIDAFKHVDIDDFVISLRSFQGGIERCQYGGCVSPAYTALKPAQQIAAGYWEYLLKSKPYIAALQAITDGIREGKTIRYEQFGWLPLPVPPVSEQGAIATFLDREIGKIDALVEAQRQLIELLKEKRQAVISHAVTKGLGPTAPTKDSGIEWLGEVPAHWEVKALKHVGEFNAGAGFPDAEQGLQSEELPFHKVNALALADPDDFLTTGGNTVSRETAKRLGAYVFPAGSIVFAKIGAALLLGRLRRLRRPACLDNNMMGLSVRDGNDLEFIRSAMSLVKFDLISNPGTVPSLNKGQIANAVIAIPPLAEQEAISAHIQQTALRYRELTTEAEAAISLLQERRAALISAAVTGKIDVRCMAPEQAEAA